MNNTDFTFYSEDIGIIIYTLKIFFISMCTYYTFLKILHIRKVFDSKYIILVIFTIIICSLCSFLKYKSDSFTSILCLIFLLSFLYSIITKNKIGYSILITITSLSINFIIFFIAIVFNFFPNIVLSISNDYINLSLLIICHITLLYLLFKFKRFKHGFTFLQKKSQNEYFDILILNISVTVLFSFTLLNNFNLLFTISLSFAFMALSIIMFITIQKTLTMYYKHNLLVKDLTETKLELEKKNKEIEELEKENLNFMKTSHSIAHKQKSLEFKLNELMLKSEIASELDIADSVNNISNEFLKNTVAIELSKTNVTNLDDMFSFMQSECIKNNIDFELQLSGNINHMVNNFVSKEDLEILIADHIKDAIIAIKHSDNVNRSILVKLGLIDGFYSLCIYDSGIEFEIDTLVNLGTKPCTTHADDGGTGMGFMNTFDTLKKYQASILINESNPPCKDNYTKSIVIQFDKHYEFKICSYRAKDIEEKN